MTHQNRFSGAIPKLIFAFILVGLMSTSAVGTALAQQPKPNLKVNDTTVNMHGQSTFTVPVLLNTDGASLSAIFFSLSYDAGCLTFDNVTDSNNDGLPDAVTTNMPPDFTAALWEIDPDEVTLSINPGLTHPLPVIENYVDKSIVDIEFGVLPGCILAEGPEVVTHFSFFDVSFGDDTGKSNGNTSSPGDYTLRFNVAPTAIALSPTSINENRPPGTVVGVLSTTDPDFNLSAPVPAEGHTYSLVDSGCSPGSYSNSLFWIDGLELKTIGSLDFETAPGYDICVRSTDNYGLSKNQSIPITVNDMVEIADIQLSNDSPAGEYHVDENEPSGHGIGQLTTLGDNQGHTYNYTLEPTGCGGVFPDNASFIIAPNDPITETNWLWTMDVFSYTEQSYYNICVRSTDSAAGANYLERTFTILIDRADGIPVAANDYTPEQPLVARNWVATRIRVLDNDVDPDGDVLKVNAKTSDGGVYFVGEYWIDFFSKGSDAANPYRGPNNFTYTAKDDPDGNISNEATVYMYLIGDNKRGDCNHDGLVDAGDLTATVLEIDDEGDPLAPAEPIQWWFTHLGGFDGSAIGCDSNGLRNGPDSENLQYSVDAADLTCTVRLSMGETCGGEVVAASATASTATLHVPDGLQVAAEQTVVVPVVLDTAGQNISAIAFTLNFDAATLNLDTADAVSLNIPAGMAKIVSVDAQAGRIHVAIFGTSLPMPLLQDGVIANVALQARADVAEGTSALDLTRVSLGDDLGQSVPVMADGNNVVIGAGGSDNYTGGSDNQVYLPQLNSNND